LNLYMRNPQVSTQRLDRLTAEFSKLDQAAAVDRIRALTDSGFTETEIATLTRWGISEVRRAIGGRL
jgi:hypothetical protein